MSQAGLLAQRDSLSPFRVVLATSAVSLAGDLLLIGRYGMGVAGAAWTTIFAQVGWLGAGRRVTWAGQAGRICFWSGFAQCMHSVPCSAARDHLASAACFPACRPSAPLSPCSRTLRVQYLGAALLLRALRRSRVVPRVRVPSRAELAALLDTFGVLTVFYAAKNLSYLLIQVGWVGVGRATGRW